jgi:sugar phosphate isomerase/epimerase
MIRLGFVSAIVADLGFEAVLDLAKEQGFSCVEMLCWPAGKAERRYAGVTHIDVGALDERRAAEIRRQLEARNITISGLGYYPNMLEAGPQAEIFRGHFLKVIDAAARLDVKVANTFIGRDPTRSLEDNLELFEKVWPPIVEHAGRAGVKIGIENCPMYFTKDEWPGGKNLAISPVLWRRMFQAIPAANFGLNYDPSHMVWQHMDYIRPLYEFKDRIFHVHLKDAKILSDRLAEVGILATPLEYHTPKLPGLGDVDWGRFFSALTDIRYNGAACIEVEDRAFEDSLESRKASLIQSRNFLRPYLPIP